MTPFEPVKSTPAEFKIVQNDRQSVMNHILSCAVEVDDPAPNATVFTPLHPRFQQQIENDNVDSRVFQALATHSPVSRQTLVLTEGSRIMDSVLKFALASLIHKRDVTIFFSDRSTFASAHRDLMFDIDRFSLLYYHSCDDCYVHYYKSSEAVLFIVLTVDNNSETWPMPVTKVKQLDMQQITRNQPESRHVRPVVIFYETCNFVAEILYIRSAMLDVSQVFVAASCRSTKRDDRYYIGTLKNNGELADKTNLRWRVPPSAVLTVRQDAKSRRKAIAIPLHRERAVEEVVDHEDNDAACNENVPRKRRAIARPLEDE